MANNVALGQSTNVVLPIDYLSIKSSTRKGNDLVVTLVNGEVIILEDYYVKGIVDKSVGKKWAKAL